MSLHEYKVSQEISAQDPSFYALIMAAFRKADSDNLGKLRCAFPLTWLEFIKRYNAPEGRLEEEEFVHPLEKYFGPEEGYWEKESTEGDLLRAMQPPLSEEEDPDGA